MKKQNIKLVLFKNGESYFETDDKDFIGAVSTPGTSKITKHRRKKVKTIFRTFFVCVNWKEKL